MKWTESSLCCITVVYNTGGMERVMERVMERGTEGGMILSRMRDDTGRSKTRSQEG